MGKAQCPCHLLQEEALPQQAITNITAGGDPESMMGDDVIHMPDTNSPAPGHVTGREQGRALRQKGRTAVRGFDETNCQLSLLQSVPILSAGTVHMQLLRL